MPTHSHPARAKGETVLQILAISLAVATLVLLFIGAMVTSTNSGLSVPDWPSTFGRNMFAYPLREMKGGIFYEHGHRLFASAVGFLTMVLVIAAWIWEKRRWVKGLSVGALIMVCLQGILGGLTVRHHLPIAVSSAHAGLAAVFFCTTLWLASAASTAWKNASAWKAQPLVYGLWGGAAFSLTQTLLGAMMRHSYAGLAIPTFPRAFGGWIPDFWSRGIFLNFLHTRVGAGVLATLCVILMVMLFRQRMRALGLALGAVLVLQIMLGMLTIWSGKIPLMASLHLAGGAVLLGFLFTSGLWAGKWIR